MVAGLAKGESVDQTLGLPQLSIAVLLAVEIRILEERLPELCLYPRPLPRPGAGQAQQQQWRTPHGWRLLCPRRSRPV